MVDLKRSLNVFVLITRRNNAMRKKTYVLTFILIIIIAFFSGCVQTDSTDSSKNSESSTTIRDSQKNSESDTITNILEQNDTSETSSNHSSNETTLSQVNDKSDISMTTDKSTYGVTERIRVSITDNANVGFSFTDDFELWELDGDKWILKSKADNIQAPMLYQVKPHPTKSSVTTMRYISLSNYKDVKPQRQYKLSITIDGQNITAEFTTI